MGCDIHLHTEVKIAGVWHHWGNPYIQRNYRLFAKMVGVRAGDEDTEQIATPNGLPSEVTPTTMIDYDRMKPDGHDESWFNEHQIEELADWYSEKYPDQCHGIEGIVGYLMGNGWYAENEAVQEVRWVFWFDN